MDAGPVAVSPAAAKPPQSESLRTAWTQQGRWSIAADRAKSSYLRWTTIAFGIVLAAAMAGTATAEFKADSTAARLLAFGSALLVGLLAVVGQFRTSPERMRSWIRARSVSEGLKTEIYSYLLRAGPYADGDARATLRNRTATIENGATDIASMTAGINVSGDPPADAWTPDDYLKKRVESQIASFYQPRAESEQKLVAGYRTAEFLLAIVGAALGAWGGLTSRTDVARWAAVVTTAISALAAHLAAGRHEYQVTTYTATALRLRQLSDAFRDSHPPGTPATKKEIDALVTECEAVISVENQGWMAQWKSDLKENRPAVAAGGPQQKGL